MVPETPFDQKDATPSEVSSEAEPAPLVKGTPLSRDESVERMYRLFDKTFEALAK